MECREVEVLCGDWIVGPAIFLDGEGEDDSILFRLARRFLITFPTAVCVFTRLVL
jgi:hypothetical protein